MIDASPPLSWSANKPPVACSSLSNGANWVRRGRITRGGNVPAMVTHAACAACVAHKGCRNRKVFIVEL